MKGLAWKRAFAMAGALALAAGAAPERAAADEETGWRVGSVVATALYAPAKVLYAATGVVAGGLGWGISGGNREAMEAVMTPALQGDYVITPEHLRGEREVEFVGAGPDAPATSLAGSEEEPADGELDEYFFYE